MLQTTPLPYKGGVEGLQSLRLYDIWRVALGRGSQRHEERVGLRSRRLRPRRDRVAAEPEDHTRYRYRPAESEGAWDAARRRDREAFRGSQGARREAWFRGSRPRDLLRRFDGATDERRDPATPYAAKESQHRGAWVGGGAGSARPCLPRRAHHHLARYTCGARAPAA